MLLMFIVLFITPLVEFMTWSCMNFCIEGMYFSYVSYVYFSYVFDDVDDIYWAHEWLLTDVINEHAPIKERVTKARKPAYMNGNLRRAVFKKRMLFNKYNKCRTSANWELYRKQRNHVTKLKKASMRVYFYERCAGGPKSKDFWPTIKPFLSKKGSDGGSEVILCEENKVVSDQAEVCSLFNSFFANVATDIGKDCYIENMEEHPSILKIQENLPPNSNKFSFRPVTDSEITKILSNIDSKKSTGVDNIPAKIVKACSGPLSGALACLINTTFHQG